MTHRVPANPDITGRNRAEQALSESDPRLAAFMDHLPCAAWLKDLQGRYVYINPEAERIFSTTQARIQGKTDEDIFPPQTARHFRDNDRRALEGHGAVRAIETLRQVDGRDHHSLVSKFAVPGPDGRPAYVAGVAHDCTPHVRGDEALRASEERLRVLQEPSPEGFTLLQPVRDAGGRIVDYTFVYQNAAIARLVGTDPNAVVGRRLLEVFPGHEKTPFHQAYQEVAESGQPRVLEALYQGDPMPRPTWLRVAVVRIGEDIAVFAQDVTQRKQTEQSQATLAAIVESSSDAIISESLDGTILSWNTGAQRLFGYSAEEAIGRPIAMLIPAGPVASAPERPEEPKAGEVLQRHDVERVRKDGSRIFVSLSVSPIKDVAGRTIGIAKVAHDITDLRRAQEDLRAAVRSAEALVAATEEANKAKDHFLAVLSHELRTPLTPVLATVSLLQRDDRADAETREHLEVIHRNADLEARLIDDLLDVTRIAKGKVALDKQPIALCMVLRQAIEVCMPDIQARKLEFGLDIQGGPFIVDADATRLQQIFWNLLKNAVKFTPHGGCVGIRVRREGNNDHVVADVTDSGVGIEPAALGHIFKPFEQESRSTTQQFGGLGLGLTITRAMVEAHGGSIEAYSEGKDKGATFRVRLPLVAASQPKAPPAARRLPPARTLHILLVEDHGDTARIMHRLLKGYGYEVEAAGDVATAVTAARRGRFDVLVSDLGLPDGSGLDIMHQLLAEGRRIPAIALSGYGQEQDIIQSREAGFAAHLTKPVNMEQLLSTIATVTSEGSSRP